MVQVTDEQFEAIVAKAIDNIPEKYATKMDNVGIVWEHDPTPLQREKLKLRCDQTLFGLYEGIPLTQRGAGYNLVLPDKITIFKNPVCTYTSSIDQLEREVGHTLWHEVAHHFGLNHDRIHALDKKGPK